MLNHILWPVDGSQNDAHVLKMVKELALQFNARVTVVHAYQTWQIIPVFETTHIDVSSLENYLVEFGTELIEKTQTTLRTAGVNATGRLINDLPSNAILNLVIEEECDLVVMGHEGKGYMKSALLGSVSRQVIHDCQCPVLLCKNPNE